MWLIEQRAGIAVCLGADEVRPCRLGMAVAAIALNHPAGTRHSLQRAGPRQDFFPLRRIVSLRCLEAVTPAHACTLLLGQTLGQREDKTEAEEAKDGSTEVDSW